MRKPYKIGVLLSLLLLLALPLISAEMKLGNSVRNSIDMQSSQVLATLLGFNQTYANLLNQLCPAGKVMNGTLANGTFICTSVSSSSSSSSSPWLNDSAYVYTENSNANVSIGGSQCDARLCINQSYTQLTTLTGNSPAGSGSSELNGPSYFLQYDYAGYNIYGIFSYGGNTYYSASNTYTITYLGTYGDYNSQIQVYWDGIPDANLVGYRICRNLNSAGFTEYVDVDSSTTGIYDSNGAPDSGGVSWTGGCDIYPTSLDVNYPEIYEHKYGYNAPDGKNYGVYTPGEIHADGNISANGIGNFSGDVYAGTGINFAGGNAVGGMSIKVNPSDSGYYYLTMGQTFNGNPGTSTQFVFGDGAGANGARPAMTTYDFSNGGTFQIGGNIIYGQYNYATMRMSKYGLGLWSDTGASYQKMVGLTNNVGGNMVFDNGNLTAARFFSVNINTTFVNATRVNAMLMNTTNISTTFISTARIKSNTPKPKVAALTGAGSGGNVTIDGTDIAGIINVSTGTAPSATAEILKVTYNVTRGMTYCIFSEYNSDAAATHAEIYITSNQTNFILWAHSPGLTTNTLYQWGYHCLE